MGNIENIAEDRKFRLRVITPLSVVYDKAVEMVVSKTVEGEWGVMYNHDVRSALLGDGVLRIFEGGKRDEEVLVVLGGVFTVDRNDVSVLSEIAGSPEEVQDFLAKMRENIAAREAVEQKEELYTRRMEIAIRQALVRTAGEAYPVAVDRAD